ncbi:MAG: right-handed parallel beta-helix repeat-containing protein, partial [Thermoplasmata archaeon]
MYRRIVAVCVSLVIVFGFIVIVDVTMDYTINVGGATLYVNTTGSGGAYTKIQDAINDSKDGDTVYVYSGIYYEYIIINKSINLTGEDRANTIIDGNDMGNVTKIVANNTQISGFTIRNHETIISAWNQGIYINGLNGNKIYNNTITHFHNGILLRYSDDNLIKGNKFQSNYNTGIYFGYSNNNIFVENILTSSIELGLFLYHSSNNTIFHNNFIDNGFIPQAREGTDGYDNIWDNGYPSGGNYWSDYTGPDNYSGPNQDLPASDGIGDIPYIIPLGGNQDNYPLIEPFKPLENYTILKPGWNLISLPLIQEEQNLTKVLKMIDGWYDAVQRFDVTDTSYPWKHYKVGKPFGNNLFELNETMGFWIHITQPGDTIFVYNGTQPTSNQTITLHPGWNMVGYPSLRSYNRTVGLNNLTFGNHVDAIWTYNAATQKWKELGPSDNF